MTKEMIIIDLIINAKSNLVIHTWTIPLPGLSTCKSPSWVINQILPIQNLTEHYAGTIQPTIHLTLPTTYPQAFRGWQTSKGVLGGSAWHHRSIGIPTQRCYTKCGLHGKTRLSNLLFRGDVILAFPDWPKI